jgi:hypothetical protein
VVLAAALPALAVGLGSLILMTSLGRTTHGWGSWQIVALAVIAVLGLAFSITATKEGGHQGPPLAVRRAPVGQALLSSRSVACRTPARFLCLRS